eukprot:TRINITY_DN681_c0_g1_i3.p1 TRINITY_DN681_c0_g1~~TRINITY_DN681_c0_g1_i3.p1  ORF type:complete len:289 (-),score=79.99 TRINITY_DN681_c0_g1_i3:38-904(-)
MGQHQSHHHSSSSSTTSYNPSSTSSSSYSTHPPSTSYGETHATSSNPSAGNIPQLAMPSGYNSHLLQACGTSDFGQILSALPSQAYRQKWTLLYGSTIHGLSFNRFTSHICAMGPTIVIIKDKGGNIFGGFVDHMWRDKHPRFYGSSNSFVFQIKPQIGVYHATGLNDHYQWMNQDTATLFNGVGMGGQERYFAWSIDTHFEAGQSRGDPTSTTFGNPILSSTPDWEIDEIEVWEVKETDVMSEEQEKLYQKMKKDKSVLKDDDNADKAITGMLGHNFSNEEHVKEDK